MTPEHKSKILAGKAAAKRDAQIVTINSQWAIHRIDGRNWQVRFKGEEQGFYGNLSTAIQAIPDKMLNETANGSLAVIMGDVKAIRETIHQALNPVKDV